MNPERRALLDHAARCRRVAGEVAHAKAAERLRSMAQEYEARAEKLEGGAQECHGNDPRTVDRVPEDDAQA